MFPKNEICISTVAIKLEKNKQVFFDEIKKSVQSVKSVGENNDKTALFLQKLSLKFAYSIFLLYLCSGISEVVKERQIVT